LGLTYSPPLGHVRRKNTTSIDGGPNGGSSVLRPVSEDPHRCCRIEDHFQGLLLSFYSVHCLLNTISIHYIKRVGSNHNNIRWGLDLGSCLSQHHLFVSIVWKLVATNRAKHYIIILCVHFGQKHWSIWRECAARN
jgi:hypothetical protein